MHESVTEWIVGLKSGHADAVQKLWSRYARQLVTVARRQLGSAPRRAADEEDVAQNVFASICRGTALGRFENVKSRDELWWLLLAITKQKTVDHIRYETAKKRGAGRTQAESTITGSANDSQSFSLDRLIGDEPTPEYVAALEEQHHRLLNSLDDERLRNIAMLRIEGFSVPEIATKLRLSTRSIERKLQLIRIAWANELEA